MVKRWVGCFLAVLVTAGGGRSAEQTVGLFHQDPRAYPGYTLITPRQDATYLVDRDGRVVHSWHGLHQPGFMAYLLEDGSLLRAAVGGRLQIADWDGKVLWDYTINDGIRTRHHDVEALPGGNVLLIVAERVEADEAIRAGRDPSFLDDDYLLPESILEVRPTGPTTGEVVWEWHAWDHLIQDFDPAQENFGVVEDRPELIDINFSVIPNGIPDWLHFNGIAYNAELDQVMVSVRQLDEIWVLDHSTTTAEAAGHSGGASGRGGDLLYRWGNPASYRAGTPTDHRLWVQHDAQWIAPGLPGAGDILVFNNGTGRPGGNFSSVDEIVPPVDGQGVYTYQAGQPFGPDGPVWTFTAPSPPDFFAPFISGAQRLPNGNTIVCHGMHGTVLEVTEDLEVVWQYINPETRDGAVVQGDPVPPLQGLWLANIVFKVRHYGVDYAGLSGRDLTPTGTIEPYRLLRNDEVRELGPVTPALSGIFTGAGSTSLDPMGDRYHEVSVFGEADPEAEVCADATRPLVFYQLDASPYTLYLVKGEDGSIQVHY